MMNPDEILEFWLGPEADRDQPSSDISKRWWQKSPAFDRESAQRFGAAVEQAGAGALDAWSDEPRGRLALILLLDQFTRNIYRDTPQMYAFDAKAGELARQGVASGADQQLRVAERTFLYMPLMHQESLADQEHCVSLFEDLAGQHSGSANNAQYARAHRDIVARFGRFPHRNEILGRSCTAEEEEFLKQPGSSF